MTAPAGPQKKYVIRTLSLPVTQVQALDALGRVLRAQGRTSTRSRSFLVQIAVKELLHNLKGLPPEAQALRVLQSARDL